METTKILKFKWIIGREDMRRICNKEFLDKTQFWLNNYGFINRSHSLSLSIHVMCVCQNISIVHLYHVENVTLRKQDRIIRRKIRHRITIMHTNTHTHTHITIRLWTRTTIGLVCHSMQGDGAKQLICNVLVLCVFCISNEMKHIQNIRLFGKLCVCIFFSFLFKCFCE